MGQEKLKGVDTAVCTRYIVDRLLRPQLELTFTGYRDGQTEAKMIDQTYISGSVCSTPRNRHSKEK